LRGINSSRRNIPDDSAGWIGSESDQPESLDLANIERIEVVQGAAAASIYGAQVRMV
jgi:outer membrane receptor protein involved in Fe transport